MASIVLLDIGAQGQPNESAGILERRRRKERERRWTGEPEEKEDGR